MAEFREGAKLCVICFGLDGVVMLCPGFADVGDDLFFAAFQLADERLVAGFFVACSPENHFGEDGREVDSFRGESVNLLAPVGRIRL